MGKIEITAHLFEQLLKHGPVRLEQGGLLIAHGLCQASKNFLIGQGVSHRLADLCLSADMQMKIAEGQVVELQETGRRQDDIGEVAGIGRKAVNDDAEQLRTAERPVQALLLGG